jgi:hypothetical protein
LSSFGGSRSAVEGAHIPQQRGGLVVVVVAAEVVEVGSQGPHPSTEGRGTCAGESVRPDVVSARWWWRKNDEPKSTVMWLMAV